MKSNLFLFLFLFATCAQAQLIPSGNRVEWDKAGFQAPLAQPKSTANVMDFGAVANGLTDDVQAVRNAISSLNGRLGVVYFPAGTYLLTSEIVLPDSVIIRGAGSTTTLIKINSTGTAFGIYGSGSGAFTPIVSGYEKDSKEITVANAALFSIGDYVEFRQDNGDWDTKPATWAVKVVGQISKVLGISGNTLLLEDKLRISYNPALNLEIQKINPRQQVRIEYLRLERTNVSTDATGNAIAFSYAVNCRIKGIESDKSQGSHCKVNASSHIEITGSYFHDANTYDGVGTKGYGIALDTHSNLCLISNNIFKHLRHAMMTKAGANGNVFAYNYSTVVYRNGSGETPTDNGGDISLHGHYSFANLFEGNIVQNLQIDEYWGPAGPYNTFFRNRTENYGIYMDATATNNSNFVGNEILHNTWASIFGISFKTTGSGNFLYGNNNNNTLVPAGTTTLPDVSYYLTAAPSFWNITDSWPSIGINNNLNVGTIPAKKRFLSGIFTVMPDDVSTVIVPRSAVSAFELFPNPARQKVTIRFNDVESLPVFVVVSDLQGKVLIQKAFHSDSALQSNSIDISTLSTGMYVVKVFSSKAFSTRLLIVN